MEWSSIAFLLNGNCLEHFLLFSNESLWTYWYIEMLFICIYILHIGNIRLLLANVGFFWTSFKNMKKRMPYRQAFISCFETSGNNIYISRQRTYIVSILWRHVWAKMLNSGWTKNIEDFLIFLWGVNRVVRIRPVSIALYDIKGQ